MERREVRVFGEGLVLSGSVQGSQNLGQEIILAQVPAGLWPLRESSNKGKLHLLLTTVLPECYEMMLLELMGQFANYWVVQKVCSSFSIRCYGKTFWPTQYVFC